MGSGAGDVPLDRARGCGAVARPLILHAACFVLRAFPQGSTLNADVEDLRSWQMTWLTKKT